MLRLRPLIRPATAVVTARSGPRNAAVTVRPSSSSSTTKKPFEPPPIKLDPTKSQLHEKAAKAARTLAEMLESGRRTGIAFRKVRMSLNEARAKDLALQEF